MARNKATWIPVNDGTPYRRSKNVHISGLQKGENCQKTPLKVLLCKARAYKRPEYQRWIEAFAKSQ